MCKCGGRGQGWVDVGKMATGLRTIIQLGKSMGRSSMGLIGKVSVEKIYFWTWSLEIDD